MSASASSIRIIWRSTNVRHRCTLSESLPTTRSTTRRTGCGSQRVCATSRSTTRRSAWPPLRRCGSVTCSKDRTPIGRRSSTIDRCSIRTCHRAPTASASWQATTVVCGTRPAQRWPSRSRRRITRHGGSRRSSSSRPSVSCGLGIGGAFAMSRVEYQRRLDERVNERTRIARELHDTLLQSFHGLLLRVPDRVVPAAGAPGRGERETGWCD